MTKSLNINFEKAVRLMVEYFPVSDGTSRKAILFHDIRIGVYLYNNGYSEDIVLAGLLHDALEWSSTPKQLLVDEFGENVVKLVLANTKEDGIMDKHEKTKELITRCVDNGEEALIVKTADILDSFKWYSSQENVDQLKYCMRNANAIFAYKPDNFNDKIFNELQIWRDRFSNLSE